MKDKLKKTLLILSLVSLLFVLSGCSGGLPKSKIELSANNFDFGDINPVKGIQKTTFFIKNSGEAPLKLTQISTSCGCTKATPSSEEIAPGEQTELSVTFDPSFHPGTVGKIIRKVYIESNDPKSKTTEITLYGNMLPGQ